MSNMLFKTMVQVSRGIAFSPATRGFKFQSTGIPGGGLGKLQGIKEEEYFARQDHKIFANMGTKPNQIPNPQFKCFNYENYIPTLCSVKHKNILEESYFLNDHCDCLQLLKAKTKKC